jgi:hypothetical protein
MLRVLISTDNHLVSSRDGHGAAEGCAWPDTLVEYCWYSRAVDLGLLTAACLR